MQGPPLLSPDEVRAKLAQLRLLRAEGRELVAAALSGSSPPPPREPRPADSPPTPPERALSGLKCLAQAGFEEPPPPPPCGSDRRALAAQAALRELRRLNAEAVVLLGKLSAAQQQP